VVTIAAIKNAIANLPSEQFWQFAKWLEDHKSDRWDQQIEEDAKAGRLDHLARKAVEAIDAGRITPL
jgi:hypothetical protein